MSLDGNIGVVTGAGSGIGKAIAVALAKAGACVVIADLSEPAGQATVRAVEAIGGKAVLQRTDVSQREDAKQLIKATVDQFGRVDILVNNAGLNVAGTGRRMENLTPEDWDMVLRVNLTGQYNMFRAVFEPMRAQKEGLIINVISTAAKNPSGVSGMAYQSAKFGMMGFGVSLNKEAWKFGIRTCNIFPDETNTDIMLKRPVKYSPEDLARILQPEDLAQAMKFVAALHPRASVHDLTLYPTFPKVYSAAETGLPT